MPLLIIYNTRLMTVALCVNNCQKAGYLYGGPVAGYLCAILSVQYF